MVSDESIFKINLKDEIKEMELLTLIEESDQQKSYQSLPVHKDS